MNYLMVKIRKRGKGNKYKKLISDNIFYKLPEDLDNLVEYSPDHNLDEDSWFAISEFSKKRYCLDILKKSFDSSDYTLLKKFEIDKIDFIFSYQNSNEYYFQKVSNSRIVSKRILYLGDTFKFKENAKFIIINDIPDAIYLKKIDKLYFKKLSTITSIFKGIDQLYKEATEEETKEFLEQSFISLDHGFSAEKVKKLNRKRIALAINTMKSFDSDEKNKIFKYIKNYCPNLEKKEDSFVIRSDEDLKSILYGIEQRYYTTPVKNEKRLANSIIVI